MQPRRNQIRLSPQIEGNTDNEENEMSVIPSVSGKIHSSDIFVVVIVSIAEYRIR